MKKLGFFIFISVFVTLLFVIKYDRSIFAQTNEQDDPYYELRKQMVEKQITARGIKDEKVIASMLSVPRHEFVPEHQKEHAYEDRPLAIGFNQTISQPYIVAIMTEYLGVNENSKVFEVGTGSGYQAAILSRIAKEVYTIEVYEELSKRANKVFDKLEYSNIKTKVGDGYYGWEEHAPYDAIIVTCAAEYVPPPLIKQLKIGGKICIPVGPPLSVQQLLLIEKKGENDVVATVILDAVRFVKFQH